MRPAIAASQRLAGSLRMASIAAAVSSIFGAVLIVWGTSLGAATMAGGGVMSVGRGLMAALIVVGIRLSRRHTTTFPFGLYKLENLFAAVAGLIILVLAYELARVSIAHLDGTFIFAKDPKYALPFFLLAALLGGVMGYYKLRISRAEGCPSLAADANFSFADSVALVIIGVALALDIAGVPRVDAIAGLIVTGFLVVIGIRILHGALKVLLDASVSRETLAAVRRFAEADPGIGKVLSVDGRNSGSFLFLHMVVEPAVPDVAVANTVAVDLQNRLRSAFDAVDSVGIEFSAPTGMVTGAVLLEADGTTVFHGFHEAPKVALMRTEQGGRPASPEIVSNPGVPQGAGAGVYLAVFLGRREVDVLLVREELTDVDVLETLRAYAVDVELRPSLTSLPDATAEVTLVAAGRIRTP